MSYVVILWIFLSAIFVEALTEIVVKSPIFESIRVLLGSKVVFFSKVLACGHCFSVWAAIVPGIFLYLWLGEGSLLKFSFLLPFLILVVRRLSNYLHNFNDKYLDKFYSEVGAEEDRK
jgi:hypothetical protein